VSFSKNLNSSSQIGSDTEWYLRTNTTKSVQERFENRRAVEIVDGQVGVREGVGLVGDAFPGGEFTIHMYEPHTPPGAVDHGALTGLGDDDHPHYFLADGTRKMTGDLDLDANDLIFKASPLSSIRESSGDIGYIFKHSTIDIVRIDFNEIQFLSSAGDFKANGGRFVFNVAGTSYLKAPGTSLEIFISATAVMDISIGVWTVPTSPLVNDLLIQGQDGIIAASGGDLTLKAGIGASTFPAGDLIFEARAAAGGGTDGLILFKDSAGATIITIDVAEVNFNSISLTNVADIDVDAAGFVGTAADCFFEFNAADITARVDNAIQWVNTDGVIDFQDTTEIRGVPNLGSCFKTTTNFGSSLNGTNVIVDWDQTASIDEGPSVFTHNPSSNPSRIEVEKTGIYLVDVILTMSTASNTVSVNAQLRVNGTTLQAGKGAGGIVTTGTHDESSVHINTLVSLAANDYIEVVCNREAGGGSVTLIAGESSICLTLVRDNT